MNRRLRRVENVLLFKVVFAFTDRRVYLWGLRANRIFLVKVDLRVSFLFGEIITLTSSELTHSFISVKVFVMNFDNVVLADLKIVRVVFFFNVKVRTGAF